MLVLILLGTFSIDTLMGYSQYSKMPDTIFIINSKFSRRTANKIKKENAKVFLINSDIKEFLKEQGIGYTYKTLDRNYLYDNTRHILNWADLNITEDKTIKELFTYKEMSLWWFMEHWINFSDGYFPYLEAYMSQIRVIKNILKQEKSKKFFFVNNGIFEDKIVIKETKKNLLRFHMLFYLKLGRTIIRKLIGRLDILMKNRKTADIIIFATGYNHPHEKRRAERELFTGISNALKNYKVAPISIPIGFKLEINNRYVPFEYYLRIKDVFKAFRYYQNTKKQWKKYSEKILNTFNFMDSIRPALKQRLDFFFSNYLLARLIEAEALENMMKKLKPKVICLMSEQGAFGRWIVGLARLNHIKVVGVQDGWWSPGSFQYMHKESQVSKEGSVKSPFCPIPDKTAVFGQNYKESLIKNANYKEEWVKVTGNVKYDFIPKIKEQYNKRDILKELNIKTKKKILLFSSQPLVTEQNKQALDIVLKCLKNNPDYYLILKLHPTNPTKNAYKKAIEDSNLKEIKIVGGCDILKLISCADVVISELSTILTEAILMNKPAIVIKDDFEGILPAADNAEDLNRLLKNISSIEKNLKEKRADFIFKNLYKIDGKASNRIAKLIEEII